MSNYDEMLKRIKLYRQKTGLFQEQIGEKLGLSQESYSYMENGETKISYEAMLLLENMGLSVDYLVSGNEYGNKNDELQDSLDNFENSDEKEFVLKLVAELTLIHIRRNKCEEGMFSPVRLLSDTIKHWDDFSMVRIVREEAEYSQYVMADKLGISVKKYRELERENRFPDGEILMQLYEISGYEPSLFLGTSGRKQVIVGRVWKLLDGKDKEKILDFIEYMKSMFR